MRIWGALLFSAAISVPAAAAPVARAPARTPAPQRQILLQADAVEYDGDAQTVSAVGHVEIADDGRTLLADRVTYDQAADKVTASGHVSVTDPSGNVSFADHVVLTDHMREGALSGFGALVGKNGRLAASSAERHDGGTIYVANHSVYSPCKLCGRPGERTPLWQVKAERVVYDQVKHRIHFTNASVDFFGVPLLYTPVLTTPDPTVRYASGLLIPDLGNSSKIGYFARLPVYIALSPTNDLTLSPMFSTLGGDVAQAEYRARWNNSGLWLQGSVAYNPEGGLGGSAAGPQVFDHLFGSGRIDMGGNWRSGFDAELTNNAAYMRFYDISTLDRLVSDLFVENDTGRSRLALTGYFFQGLRSTDLASQIPYVAPLLDYSFIPLRNIGGGQFRFDLNAVALSRGSGDDEQRLTAEMRWQLPLVFGGGQLWTVVADARGDAYRLQTPQGAGTQDASTTLSRGIPYVALDWRWPFLSEGGGGRSYILEPIAQLVAQPYGGNPAALLARNEDASDFEFSDTNIFSFNQLPGYDIVESGPRANIGFNAETIFPGGEVQALVGQTYRLKPDPVFAALSGENGTASDVVGRFSVKFAHLDVTDRIDVDRGNGSINRHEIYLTGTYNRSAFQISYVQLPAESASLGLASREEVNGQADINFYENWQVFAASQYDLLARQFLNTEYGLGYENDCLAVSLAYRRKYTFDTSLGVPPSTSVILRFSLKTGDQPVQPFSLFPQNVFDAVHP